MANAIEQLRSMTVGHFGLGMYGDGPGSPAQKVHDGDTVSVGALGDFPVRLLGIDTPEVSYALPGAPNRFISTSDERWAAFLSNPFAPEYGPIELDDGLKQYLLTKLGPETADNHYRLAKRAERAFEQEIVTDMSAMGWTKDTCKFFLVFATEVVDRYGRLLAYINREDISDQRPLDYNQRQLRQAVACPYFIWPNVNPFRKQASILEAVLQPGTAANVADSESTLRNARTWIANARQNQFGIFDSTGPLMIEPFELRYLAGRRAPNRWVIDLSKNDNVLIAPQHYYQIAHLEDRLYIPEEYVDLFVNKGWYKQAVTAAAPAAMHAVHT